MDMEAPRPRPLPTAVVDSLSCVKGSSRLLSLPASLSLHSVDLPELDPGSHHPGLVTVTLRMVPQQRNSGRPGSGADIRDGSKAGRGSQVRVVHGTVEVHRLVQEAIRMAFSLGYKRASTLQAAAPDPSWQEDDHQASPAATEEHGDDQESHTEVGVKVVGGVWTLSLANVTFRTEEFGGVQVSCAILEALIAHGWEVVSAPNLDVTPGHDLMTLVVKKSTTSPPLYTAQVAAVVLGEEGLAPATAGSVSAVLGPTISGEDDDGAGGRRRRTQQVQLNNVLRRSLAKCLKGSGGTTSSTAAAADDPDCPSRFWIPERAPGGAACRWSDLVLEVVHQLFCRQWRLIADYSGTALSGQLPDEAGDEVADEVAWDGSLSSSSVLFFCHDGRILPALGQRTFAMVELDRPGTAGAEARFLNVEQTSSSDMSEDLAASLHGAFLVTEVQTAGRGRGSRRAWALCRLLLSMNRMGFNLYGSTTTIGTDRCQDHRPGPPSGPRPSKSPPRKVQFIFRQSNVSFSDALCLHLSGRNRILVVGGGQQEVGILRDVILTHWPYPLAKDEAVEDEASADLPVWLFKVKRCPWATSYGDKRIDWAAEFVRRFLQGRVSVRPPRNTDPDSGKGLLIFALKGLAEIGWRVQMSTDICSDVVCPTRYLMPRLADPHSIFLLR